MFIKETDGTDVIVTVTRDTSTSVYAQLVTVAAEIQRDFPTVQPSDLHAVRISSTHSKYFKGEIGFILTPPADVPTTYITPAEHRPYYEIV